MSDRERGKGHFPFLVEKLGLGPSMDQLRAIGVVTSPFERPPDISPKPRGIQLETSEEGLPIFPEFLQPVQEEKVTQSSQAGALADPKSRMVVQVSEQDSTTQNPYADLLEGRKKWAKGESVEVRKRLFHWAEVAERHRGMRLLRDVIGVLRHLPIEGGKIKVQSTPEKQREEEVKSGHPESSVYGRGHINGKRVTFFGQLWENFAGTAGIITGKKLAYAASLARITNTMFVAYLESGGARIQDGTLGLVEVMVKAPHNIWRFKRERKQPYVAVLGPNVWGGMAAGALPDADITAAYAGGDAGFAGGGPVGEFQKSKMGEGAQSVEAHAWHRNLMVVVRDEIQMQQFLEGVAQHSGEQRGITGEEARELPPITEKPYVRFPTRRGLSNWLDRVYHPEEFAPAGVPYEFGIYLASDNYKNFILLSRDARRPDTQYLAAECFDDLLPLSNDQGMKHVAIEFYLGKIGPQTVLIAGYQPSYHVMYKDNQSGQNMINKTPASPGCADYRLLKRVLRYGERMGYPLITFVDLLGARPTKEEELQGIFNEISECRQAVNYYDGIVMTYITGVLGSGGGIALAAWGQYIAMFEDAQSYVAEPASGASILHPTQPITPDLIKLAAQTSRPTARDMDELQLIHNIVYQPPEGPYINQLGMAQALRDDIAINLARLNKLSKRTREHDRDERLRHLGISPVRHS